MILRVLAIIYILFLSSCVNHEVKEYYENGSLKTLYRVSNDSIKNGYYYIYYKNGKLKEKRSYINDKIIDTIKHYDIKGSLEKCSYMTKDSVYLLLYRDGVIFRESKSAIDYEILNYEDVFSGWIKEFKDGELEKKLLYLSIKKKKTLVQYITYDSLNNIDKNKSFYYNINVGDTIVLEQKYVVNIPIISDIKKENLLGYKTIVSDKIEKYFSNIDKIPLDTLYYDNNPVFVYIPKEQGKITIRGKITEKFIDIDRDKDSINVTLTVRTRDSYFKKNIYVKGQGNGTD